MKNETFFHLFRNQEDVHEYDGYILEYGDSGVKVFEFRYSDYDGYEGEWKDYSYLNMCVLYETNEELLCVHRLVNDITNKEDFRNFPQNMSGYHKAKALYRSDRLSAYRLISEYGYGMQFLLNDLKYDVSPKFEFEYLNFYEPPRHSIEGNLRKVVFGEGEDEYEYGTNSYYWTLLQAFIRAPQKDILSVTKELKELPYKEFLQTPYWKAVSWQVKLVSNFKCHICDSGKNLEAHHVTYKNRGYEFQTWKKDLICICKNCHSLLHEKEGSKIKRPR